MNTYEFNFLKSPDETSKSIVERMKARRKELKITQKRLSELSDVSYGSIKRYEATGEISLTSLIKIAYVLDCEDDFDHLFAKKKYRSIQELIDEQT